MGLLGNLFLSGLTERRNQRRNHVSDQLIGFVPENGNLIICGGSTEADSFDRQIKDDTFFDAIDAARREKTPTLCIYSNPNLTARIEQEWFEDDRVCIFGRGVSYIPFDRNITFDQANNLFETAINKYKKAVGSSSDAVGSILSMLLSILRDNLDQEYFTYENLRYLVSHLIKTGSVGTLDYSFSGEQEFLNWIERETGTGVNGFYQNLLTLGWTEAVTKFYSFWLSYDAQIRRLAATDAVSRSAYSCLLDRHVCVCYIPEYHSELLLETLLSELFFLRDSAANFRVIDYGVRLETEKKDRLFDRGRFLLIGNTFSSLGIEKCAIPEPSCVCLGVSNQDAAMIFRLMVTTGRWTQRNMGVGRRKGGISFSDSRQEPITTDALSYANLPDGSAYLITPEGYHRIGILLA